MSEDRHMMEDPGSTLAVDDSSFDYAGLIERLPEINVPIDSLVDAFHLRESGVNTAHVQMLADAVGSVRLPPILVQKNGSRIIDGMHRLQVAMLHGECSIRARVVDCTDEEAFLLAIKSNTLHGLPLSRADRVSSAKRILTSHPDWSDRAIAGITGLGTKAVASLRDASSSAQLHVKRLGRDGKRRPVVPGEGRLRAVQYISEHPDASVRQIAREVNVSVGTAQDVRERVRRGVAGLADGPTRTAEGACGNENVAPAEAASSRREPRRRTRGSNVENLDWSIIAAKMNNDPALRYTEDGRAFLRWLSMHSMQAGEWQYFINSIPERWLDDVRRITSVMSEEWHRFGESLKCQENNNAI